MRLTNKLAKKIKVTPERSCPADPNLYADWTAHLFTADRVQYILISNTASLYSMVMHGKGISQDYLFLDRVTHDIADFLCKDDNEFIFRKFVAPSMGKFTFATALNRSVTGSMNELAFMAKVHLIETEISLFDISFKLNESFMSYIGSKRPREAFMAMALNKKRAE